MSLGKARMTDAHSALLYVRVMGDQFATLPAAVRDMHNVHGDCSAAGEGVVERGSGALARILCRIMRFPPAGSYEAHVTFAERNGVEVWTRDFGGHRFSSVLRQSGSFLTEGFGPLRFGFDLVSSNAQLIMKPRGWSVAGLPLPLLLGPRIEAHEWEADGRFRFSVGVSMPWFGPVIRYSGWLERID